MEHEAYEKGWFRLLAMSQGPNPPNPPIRPWSSPDLNNLNVLYSVALPIAYCIVIGIYLAIVCKLQKGKVIWVSRVKRRGIGLTNLAKCNRCRMTRRSHFNIVPGGNESWKKT